MASVVITDIYRVNKDSLSSVSSQSQVQSNIHKQSKTYLFELRGCLLTNTRETSVSSTGNNKTTKHFKRPPVPRYRWCLMPGCSSWEHGAKTLPFKLKRWLFLSKRVCSSHSGVLSLGDVTCKKNPDPLVGQSASSCWVAKKKEKIDSIATVATKLPSFLLCRSSSVPTEWLYALSWPFTSSRIKLVTLITKKINLQQDISLYLSLTAGSSGSFVSV